MTIQGTVTGRYSTPTPTRAEAELEARLNAFLYFVAEIHSAAGLLPYSRASTADSGDERIKEAVRRHVTRVTKLRVFLSSKYPHKLPTVQNVHRGMIDREDAAPSDLSYARRRIIVGAEWLPKNYPEAWANYLILRLHGPIHKAYGDPVNVTQYLSPLT